MNTGLWIVLTPLGKVVSSLYLLLFLNLRLSSPEVELHQVNHGRKPLRLGTQTVLSIIFGECLTNTRGFFHNQFFGFPKGILYIGII